MKEHEQALVLEGCVTAKDRAMGLLSTAGYLSSLDAGALPLLIAARRLLADIETYAERVRSAK